jgi:hypothetical protein
MEKHPEIPSELYGRWWKVINDEYGAIIEEDESDPQIIESSIAPPSSETRNVPERSTRNDYQPTTTRDNNCQNEGLSKDEEEQLADYLHLGMTLKDARAAFKVELEAAELRFKVRESQRARQAGSIQVANRHRPGPSSSTRGGLTFN